MTHASRVVSIDAELSSGHKQKSACKRPQQCSCVQRHTKHINLALLQEKDPKDLWRTPIFYVKIRNTLYSFSLLSNFCSNQIFWVITSFSEHHKNQKDLGQPVSLSFCILQTNTSFWYKSKLHYNFTYKISLQIFSRSSIPKLLSHIKYICGHAC